MKKRIVLIIIIILLVILWGVVIYKLSDMNTINSNEHSTNIISVILEKALQFTNDLGITNSHPNESKIEHASSLLNSPFRKLMHASVYFILAFIVIIFINMLFKNNKYLISLCITIILCFIFALTDEYHQTLVEGITGKFMDVLIDTSGAFAGTLFYGTYYCVYKIGRKSKYEEELNKKIENI